MIRGNEVTKNMETLKNEMFSNKGNTSPEKVVSKGERMEIKTMKTLDAVNGKIEKIKKELDREYEQKEGFTMLKYSLIIKLEMLREQQGQLKNILSYDIDYTNYYSVS